MSIATILETRPHGTQYDSLVLLPDGSRERFFHSGTTRALASAVRSMVSAKDAQVPTLQILRSGQTINYTPDRPPVVEPPTEEDIARAIYLGSRRVLCIRTTNAELGLPDPEPARTAELARQCASYLTTYPQFADES